MYDITAADGRDGLTHRLFLFKFESNDWLAHSRPEPSLSITPARKTVGLL